MPKHAETDELEDEMVKSEREHHDDGEWNLDMLPEGIREYAEKAKEYAMKSVEENPGRALAIAFGAGALAAAFLGGTKSGRKTARKVLAVLPKNIRKPIKKALPV